LLRRSECAARVAPKRTLRKPRSPGELVKFISRGPAAYAKKFTYEC
jgi:hypothetical protein